MEPRANSTSPVVHLSCLRVTTEKACKLLFKLSVTRASGVWHLMTHRFVSQCVTGAADQFDGGPAAQTRSTRYRQELDNILGEYSRQWAAQRRDQAPAARSTQVPAATAAVATLVPPAEHPVAVPAQSPADDGYDDDIIDDVIADVDSGSANNTTSTEELLEGLNGAVHRALAFGATLDQRDASQPNARSSQMASSTRPSVFARQHLTSTQLPYLTKSDDGIPADISISSCDSDSQLSPHVVTTPQTHGLSSANVPVISHQYLSSLLDDENATITTNITSTDTSMLLHDDTSKQKDFDDDKRSDSGVSDSTLDDDDRITVVTSHTIIDDMFNLGRYSSVPVKPRVEVTAYPVHGVKSDREKMTSPQRNQLMRAMARPQPTMPPDDSVLEGQQLVARFAPSPSTDPMVQIIEVQIFFFFS